ncbi:multiple epidermal growth factor-like domains protein 10, partial [Ylistrum balloti]|uniref:multiple epidermal growth factor-like domains protein 10 n=1 Tax=Ylistrum balloti TaxID=509963 RepID=UPI002905D317
MSEFIKSQNVGFCIVFLMASFGTHFIDASRDLALHKNSKQSSTHKRYEAGRAVDGVLGIDVTDGHCSHTGLYHRQAWWEVDLGHIYRIQTINITYRRSRTDHLKDYSLYVANNRSMTMPDGFINEQLGYLCYHDADSTIPTYNQSRPCHVDGRYVVFYNNRKNEDAFVELCGIQVYGCPTGKFGFMCSDTCHCQSSGCNPDTGECDVDGCQTGWMGLSCSLRCHCNSGGACNIDTGACSGGCQSGWSGRSCAVWQYTFRMSGFYLYISNSSYNNSQALSRDYLCYHDHGPGLPSYIQSLWCSVSGRYVIFYNKRPADYEPLNVKYYSERNATIELCEVQVIGVCDPGKFGKDCSQTCHCVTSDCNKLTGSCLILGCSAGWAGKACDQVCSHGHFGPDCRRMCHCNIGECNRIDGTCNISGCVSGWSGVACDTDCDLDRFGENCIHKCHCKEEGCDNANGKCKVTGCMDGWKGTSCDQ